MNSPSRLDRNGALVGVLLVLAPFVALSPEFIPRALLCPQGDVLVRLPKLVDSARRLLTGEVAWTPALGLGQPLLGDASFSTLYPPKLLLLIFDPFVAYAAYLVLHHLLAEFGAYFYVKRLGCGRLGACFGALAYGYSAAMLDCREQTTFAVAVAWLPLLLLLFDRAATTGRARTFAGAAIAFCMVPFSGAIELTFYLIGGVVLLAGARALFERRRRTFFATLLVLGPALLVSAVQLLPSWDFARQLATARRPAYELAATPDPLLLSAVYLPLPPAPTSFYMRAGVSVVCASAVAVRRFRAASAPHRAWMVVLAATLSLMLVRHLPPISRRLHGLPVLGGESGPLHDQALIGLALAVLGAWGIEQARGVGAGSVRRWLLVSAAVGSTSWLALWIAGTSNAAGEDAVKLWSMASIFTALGASLACLLWIFALARRGQAREQLAWMAVALLPLLETAWANRTPTNWRQSLAGALQAASDSLPQRSGVLRILSPPTQSRTGEPVASAASLAGSTMLLHRDVEGLLGTPSADAAFDDLLGFEARSYPSSYGELAYSVLPSLFGVTHVVLPSMVCDKAELALAADGQECSRSVAQALTKLPRDLGRRRTSCKGRLTDAVRRFQLEVDIRAAAADGANVVLEYGGYGRRSFFELYVPGDALGPEFRRHASSVDLLDALPAGVFRLSNRTRETIELRDAGLYAAHESGAPMPIGTPLGAAKPSPSWQLVSPLVTRNHTLSVSSAAEVVKPMHLPVRPVEVTLDARASTLEHPLAFGLELPTTSPTRLEWQVAARDRVERRKTRHVALLPPDLREASLFVEARDDAALVVYGFTAVDACTRRDYRNPVPLDDGLFLYENHAALPRAYAVGKTVYASTTAEVRKALLDFETSDLGTKAVVSEPMPPDLSSGRVVESNIGIRRADIVVRSDDGPTLLVLNDRYDRNWHATIGALPARIIPVNGIMRGVIVPRGTHRVTFLYATPRSVWVGLALAVAGLLAAFLAAPLAHRRWFADISNAS